MWAGKGFLMLSFCIGVNSGFVCCFGFRVLLFVLFGLVVGLLFFLFLLGCRCFGGVLCLIVFFGLGLLVRVLLGLG